MENDITIVTRTFQPKKNLQEFDVKKFQESFIKPLYNLTKDSNVKKIIVIFNADKGNKHAEEFEAEQIPSYIYLKQLTNLTINNIKIEPSFCNNWGDNQGSATALNVGLKSSVDTSLLMIWSSEMRISSKQLKIATQTLINENLNLLGFLRNNWEERIQWQVPQNTACIWRLEDLQSLNFFDEFCNGNENQNIYSDDGECFKLSGMEDFFAMIQLAQMNCNFRFGMIGVDEPIYWAKRDTDHTNNKIQRQSFVMNRYMNLLQPRDTIVLYQRLFYTLNRYSFNRG